MMKLKKGLNNQEEMNSGFGLKAWTLISKGNITKLR